MTYSTHNSYDDISPSAESLAQIRPDLRVAFILMNQFTLAPVSGLVESLRFAADKSFRSLQIYCKWDWITFSNQSVSASCGLSVNPTKEFSLQELKENYDYVVIAGGLLTETREPSPALLEALKEIHAAQVPIIALCSGCFVLGNAGLLNGRKCAIHFTTRDEFASRFPQVTTIVDQSYVEDHGILTCPGGTAIDLAAHLIRQHCGDIRAHKTLEYLLVNGEKPQEQKAEEIALNPPNTYENLVVRQAIAYMRENLASHTTLQQVSAHVKTNPRQLHRIFIANTHESPAHYWRKLRLDHSKKLLANTNNYITNIAIECGFSDASHFILWFKKQYGETPFAYRKRRHEAERLQ